MSLFYQITRQTSNVLKPISWNLSYTTTQFNVRDKKFDPVLPQYGVPYLFSNDRILNSKFISSNKNKTIKNNDSVDSDRNANLLADFNITKARSSESLNLNNTTKIYSNYY